jgi:glycosyltransferase involved in cell wall biosynthesis
VLRAVSSRLAGETVSDRFWDRMIRSHDQRVARLLGKSSAVYGYEYSSLETFREARRRDITTLLDLPALSSRQFEELKQEELRAFPDWANDNAVAYFDSVHKLRQARRDEEIALADVILVNSNLTKASHVADGVDPSRIHVVPLAAPPALQTLTQRCSPENPLRIVFVGSFILRKGAQYLVEAMKDLKGVHLDIYGSVLVPDQVVKHLPESVHIHGPAPHSEALSAIEQADMLVLPSLSDGFGMVVTEALSRGTPVITTRNTGASELIVNGRNGLIVPARDAVALRRALEWCRDSRMAVYAMREEAIETARRWQWPDYRIRLSDVIGRSLEARGPRS